MIFTLLAPRLIQSIIRIVHNKKRALKRLCILNGLKQCTAVQCGVELLVCYFQEVDSLGKKAHMWALVCASKLVCALAYVLVCALVCSPKLVCALVCRPKLVCVLVCDLKLVCGLVYAPKLVCALLSAYKLVCALVCASKLICVSIWFFFWGGGRGVLFNSTIYPNSWTRSSLAWVQCTQAGLWLLPKVDWQLGLWPSAKLNPTVCSLACRWWLRSARSFLLSLALYPWWLGPYASARMCIFGPGSLYDFPSCLLQRAMNLLSI